MIYCEAFSPQPQASDLLLPEAINISCMVICKLYYYTSNNYMVWQYSLYIAIQHMVRKLGANYQNLAMIGDDQI